MLLALASVVLGASLLFGGGTRAGFAGDIVCQLLAVPLLLVAVHRGWDRPEQKRRILLLLSGVVLLAALQLIPLPAGLADRFAVNALAGQGLDAIGQGNVWRPLSLTPHLTGAALVSLLVPIALFLGVADLDAKARQRLATLITLLGAVSLVLGLLQVAQGPQSPLRFYEFTNPSEAVGFFANRNHFAALLSVVLLLGAAWLIASVNQTHVLGRRAAGTRTIFVLAAAFVLIVAVMAGIAMARSRAGLLLAVAALVGIALMLLWERFFKDSSGRGRLVAVMLGFAVLFAAQFGIDRVMTRFEADPLQDLRLPLATTTIEEVGKTLPLGTGLGSFVPVYASAEKTSDLFSGYANRAHNDFAEWALETGALGIALGVLFLLWYAKAVWRAWSAGDDRLFSRAATVIVALLLIHSLVDYPLRTTALAAVFAVACALLVPLPNGASRRDHHRHHDQRADVEHRQRRQPTPVDMVWPEAWAKPLAAHQGAKAT